MSISDDGTGVDTDAGLCWLVVPSMRGNESYEAPGLTTR